MRAFVFLGPSLPKPEAEALLDAVYLEPVKMGDLYVLAEARAQPGDHVAIVDGFFEQVPAVWHKEVLYALSRGIHVYGAASMGALRASELHAFGMQGVGRIFEAYRDGVVEDDDEVAVGHAPARYGFRPLSDAMISIRFALDELVAGGALAPELAADAVAHVKAMPYGERSWFAVIDRAKDRGASEAALAALETASRQPSAKAEDAKALLRLVAAKLTEPAQPFRAQFSFQHTSYWASLTQSLTMRVADARRAPGDARRDERAEEVAAAVRAGGSARERLLDDALLDRLALDAGGAFVPSRTDLQHAARRLAWRHGLRDADAIRRWREERQLGDAEWRELLETDARRYWLRGRLVRELDAFALLRAKADGSYGTALRTAGAAREQLARAEGGKPSVEDYGLTYEMLQSWYERRMGPMAPDPAAHARDYGFPSLRSFLTAVLGCYLAERRARDGEHAATADDGAAVNDGVRAGAMADGRT